VKLLLAFFLVSLGCSRFPYTDLIEQSASFVKATYPDSFKSLIIDNENIHYISIEEPTEDPLKPLIIFIHGSPGSWKSFANFLKNKDLQSKFELIAFDRFGYKNNRDGVVTGRLADQALIPSSIINLKRKQNPKRKIIIVGHSYGGPVALKTALLNSRANISVVLVAASMDPKLEEELWYQSIAKLWGIRSLLPGPLDVVNREIIFLKSELKVLDKEYTNIDFPVIVIQGGEDMLVPRENIDYLKMKLNLNKTSYIEIDDMNHFIPWGHPQLIEDAILKLSKD
jgi:pimeloyl-ACP methyl ester carboxylesterase